MAPWRIAASPVLLGVTLALLLDSSLAKRAEVHGRQLIVDGAPFHVKGVCYSPTPINESVYFAPYGDYFTADYSFIWLRDLPLIKAMGANIVRTYGWQPHGDHTAFLDAAHNNGLYVMATFYMGAEEETPVSTAADRSKVISAFVHEVARYSEHRALLFWSFGNELNGVWNGFLQAIGKDPEQPDCNWDDRYDDLGGCWIHLGQIPNASNPCYTTSYCVYKRLFSFIGDAATAAKEVAEVLVISAFADVDGLNDKVDRAGDYAADLDAWTAQVYRGSSFGNFFAQMGNATSKPVLLTEYGVDAYHDVCGADTTTTPCFNTVGDNSASYVDGVAQAAFAMNLTREIINASSTFDSCSNASKGSTNCTCIGGFLMSWTDEYWKGAKAQAACTPTISSAHFSPKKCQNKAHVTCGNWDTGVHDLCGYYLDAAPDHYVNEEWFGLTSPSICANSIDALEPRQIYWTMRRLWTGATTHDHSLFNDCDEQIHGRCVSLGDGGSSVWLIGSLLGATPRRSGSPPLPCSGRGKCTTDWQLCGPGGANATATPCCSCHFGYAGEGCTELDVRIYVAIAGAATLAALLAAMTISSICSSITARRVRVNDLHERLISE